MRIHCIKSDTCSPTQCQVTKTVAQVCTADGWVGAQWNSKSANYRLQD